MNQVIVEAFSFLQKLGGFPNQDFGNQISNRLRLNMIAHDLNIVFRWFEKKVHELI